MVFLEVTVNVFIICVSSSTWTDLPPESCASVKIGIHIFTLLEFEENCSEDAERINHLVYPLRRENRQSCYSLSIERCNRGWFAWLARQWSHWWRFQHQHILTNEKVDCLIGQMNGGLTKWFCVVENIAGPNQNIFQAGLFKATNVFSCCLTMVIHFMGNTYHQLWVDSGKSLLRQRTNF